MPTTWTCRCPLALAVVLALASCRPADAPKEPTDPKDPKVFVDAVPNASRASGAVAAPAPRAATARSDS
jgi:hypothetical protein